MPDHKGYQGQQANNYKCTMNVLSNAFFRAVNLKKNEIQKQRKLQVKNTYQHSLAL